MQEAEAFLERLSRRDIARASVDKRENLDGSGIKALEEEKPISTSKVQQSSLITRYSIKQ